MTSEELVKYVYFITEILPLLMKPVYTLMDELNLHIKYFKGVDILTYYTPSDPTKDKEPKLNKTLQKKWQPQKTVAHKLQLEKESEMKAKNRLMQGPAEHERKEKNSESDEISPKDFLHLHR